MANRVTISTVATSNGQSSETPQATIFDESYQDSGLINFKGLNIDEATALITNPETAVATVLKYGNTKAKIMIHNASTQGVERFAKVDMDFDMINWAPLEKQA